MSVPARLRALARAPLARNALALYAVGVTAYLFPLVTAPYLARVLRPEGWGRVALAQSGGQVLAVVVEYGFLLSATREIARVGAAERGAVLGSVLGAKAALAVVVIALAAAAGAWVPALAGAEALVAGAAFWAVAQGFHPLWYFQGRERVRPLLVLDLAAAAVGIAGVVWTCRAPADAWKVLAWQGSAAAAVAIGGYTLAARESTLHWPTRAAVGARLARGARLFAYRATVALYTLANPIVLGLFTSAAVVGHFAGAERIVKAIFMIAVYPLNQALYPRASRRALASAPDARRALGGTIASFGVVGALIGVLVFASAPWLVRVVLGPAYEPAIAAVRILAWLLPTVAVSTTIVMQRVLPAEHDRTLLAVTLAAGLSVVVLATLLAPRWGAVGMAWAVVATEAGVMLALVRALRATP